MKDDEELKRLITLPRLGRALREPASRPPFGLTTRIASRALAAREDDPLVLWERMARWCLAVALVACIATAALHPRADRSSARADFAGLNESAENLW